MHALAGVAKFVIKEVQARALRKGDSAFALSCCFLKRSVPSGKPARLAVGHAA